MSKKVKLAEVNKDKWKVTKPDQATVSRSQNTLKITEAMENISKQTEANLALSQEMIKALVNIANLYKEVKQTDTPQPGPQAPVEVTVIQDNVKKKFRLTHVRDEHGFIAYSDIEQL